MDLNLEHHTTQQEAIDKIDGFLDELMKRQFENVKISKPHKEWTGNLMDFSFKVSKGMTFTKVSGTVQVDSIKVRLDAKLGLVARQLVSEDLIQTTIEKHFKEIFGIN